MSKILKNNTAAIIALTDVGMNIPANGSLTIHPEWYLQFAASADAAHYLSDRAVNGVSTLTMNDGNRDLLEADALSLLKGSYPSVITVEVPVENFATIPYKSVVFRSAPQSSGLPLGTSWRLLQAFRLKPSNQTGKFKLRKMKFFTRGGSTECLLDVYIGGSFNSGSNPVTWVDVPGTELQELKNISTPTSYAAEPVTGGTRIFSEFFKAGNSDQTMMGTLPIDWCSREGEDTMYIFGAINSSNSIGFLSGELEEVA